MEFLLCLEAVFCLSLLLMLVRILHLPLQAVSVYTLSRRRGVGHAWLAWVPLLSDWQLGALADAYHAHCFGYKTRRRWLLLVTNALWIPLSIFCLQGWMDAVGRKVTPGTQTQTDTLLSDILSLIVLVGPILVPIFAIWATVLWCKCYSELYVSCAGDKATQTGKAFAIFSLFSLRHTDEGL